MRPVSEPFASLQPFPQTPLQPPLSDGPQGEPSDIRNSDTRESLGGEEATGCSPNTSQTSLQGGHGCDAGIAPLQLSSRVIRSQ